MGTVKRDTVREQIVAALPAWQVLVVRYNAAVAARLGVTPSDLEALFVLSRRGPCTPGVLGRHVGLTTGSASRLVDRLVAAGLVTRGADPDDRRRTVVTPSADALAEVARHYTPLNERLHAHLAPFDDAGLAALLAFVRGAEASTRELLDRPPEA